MLVHYFLSNGKCEHVNMLYHVTVIGEVISLILIYSFSPGFEDRLTTEAKKIILTYVCNSDPCN